MSNRWIFAIVVSLCLVAACNRDPNAAKQKYLESGNKYFQNKKYKEALIMYRKALQKDLKFGEAYYRSALANLELNRYVEASRDLQRSIELQPDNLDAHNRLSNLYLNVYLAKRPKQVLSELKLIAEKYEKRFPASYENARLKGYMAIFDADYPAALASFEKAQQIKPWQQDLILVYMQTLARTGKPAEGEKLAQEMLSKQPNALPVYDALALMYLAQKRTDDVEKLLKLKIEKNPKLTDPRLQLAAHYYTQKSRDQMMATLGTLTSNATDFPRGEMSVGDFFLRIREYDLASQHYMQGVQRGGKDKALYQKRLVEVLVKQDKKDQANQMVAEILKENPKDDEAIAIRASLALLTGTREQIQSAINDLQTVITRMPENPVLRYNLGRAHMARQNWQAAKVQFEEAIKLNPGYVPPRVSLAQILLQNRDWARASQAAQEALSIDPNNVQARLLRTRALIGMGEFKQARTDLAATAQTYPNLPEARMQLAALDLQERNYKDAEESFRSVYAKSQDPRAFMGLIDSYVGQGQHAAATKLLREEFAKHPDRLEYQAAVANIAMIQRDYKTAVAEYNNVLQKAPKNSQVWLQLSEAHRRLGDMSSAMTAVKKAQETAPANPAPHLQLALLYDQAGSRTEAKPAYEQVLKLQPENPIALNNLAFLLAESGSDLDQALTMAQKARQQFPNDLNIADTLSWIYIKKNLADSAIGILRDLVQKEPNRSTFNYHLAVALLQKGDKVQAKRYAELALKGQPANAEANAIRELLTKIG